MKKSFLSGTRPQIRILVILLLALVGLLFSPGLQALALMTVRNNPVRNGQISAHIPGMWLAKSNDGSVNIWKPCWTVLCSTSRSSINLVIDSRVGSDEYAWERVVVSAIQNKGFPSPHPITFARTSASLKCFEAVNKLPPGQAISTCYSLGPRFVATFLGQASDLPTFYEIVTNSEPVVKIN
jgi:hypothetical protein